MTRRSHRTSRGVGRDRPLDELKKHRVERRPEQEGHELRALLARQLLLEHVQDHAPRDEREQQGDRALGDLRREAERQPGQHRAGDEPPAHPVVDLLVVLPQAPVVDHEVHAERHRVEHQRAERPQLPVHEQVPDDRVVHGERSNAEPEGARPGGVVPVVVTSPVTAHPRVLLDPVEQGEADRASRYTWSSRKGRNGVSPGPASPSTVCWPLASSGRRYANTYATDIPPATESQRLRGMRLRNRSRPLRTCTAAKAMAAATYAATGSRDMAARWPRPPAGGLRRPERRVDLAVVALTDPTPADGGEHGHDDHQHERDQRADPERPGARDGRQVELSEQVELGAEDRARDRQQDGDHEPDDPHAEPLTAAVEARHAARHVATREVGDRQHDQEDDAPDYADRPRLADGLALAADRAAGDRPADRAGEREQQHRHAGGHEPAEERRPPVEAAEPLLRVRSVVGRLSVRHVVSSLLAFAYRRLSRGGTSTFFSASLPSTVPRGHGSTAGP